MGTKFQKDNPLNLQLAIDAHSRDAENSNNLEIAICHTLYRRHPDAMEDILFLRAVEEIGLSDELKSVVHDLEIRGILRVDVMGNRTLYTLTREFYSIMSHL